MKLKLALDFGLHKAEFSAAGQEVISVLPSCHFSCACYPEFGEVSHCQGFHMFHMKQNSFSLPL